MPRPYRETIPGLSTALAVLGAGAVRILPLLVALAAAAGCALFGLLRAAPAFRARRVLERRADALLRTGVAVHPHSALLVWRAGKLTSDRNRKLVVHGLEGVIREVEGRLLPGPIPLNRSALRPHLPLLRKLAGRVGELEFPIAPRGMVLVDELLTDGYSSPLYGGGSADPEPVLECCLRALDEGGVARPASDSRTSNASFSELHRSQARVHSGGSR